MLEGVPALKLGLFLASVFASCPTVRAQILEKHKKRWKDLARLGLKPYPDGHGSNTVLAVLFRLTIKEC